MHEIVLAGCTPEPLMSYLKALGGIPSCRGAIRPGRPRLLAGWTLRAPVQAGIATNCRSSSSKTTSPRLSWALGGARSGFFYPGSSESSAREALECNRGGR